MPKQRRHVPSYRFAFPGGLSEWGMMERVSDSIDGGRIHRYRYAFNDRPLVRALGRHLPAQLTDFLDVCAAIYLSDRQGLRALLSAPRPPDDRYHRRLTINLPVRHPEVWNSEEVRQLLEELVYFLTGDDWLFEFTRREAVPRPAEGQAYLFVGTQIDSGVAVLHSGGLDALFGLIEVANSGQDQPVFPVSVITHPRTLNTVNGVLEAVRPEFPSVPFVPLRLHVRLSRLGRPLDDRESSQRARSLLYLSAGIVAAALTGDGHLRLTENGPGAINLPCTRDQIGPRATRSTHPKTLALIARLASVVLGRPIAVTNLGLFATKGELAAHAREPRFWEAVRRTVSCERFPYRRADDSCGTCSSCIYRRIALDAARLSHLDHPSYRVDVLSSEVTPTRHDLVPLFAQRALVARLKQPLASAYPSAALVAHFPMLEDAVEATGTRLTENESMNGLVRLFQTYVQESESFFAKVDRPGWRIPDAAAASDSSVTRVAS